MIPELSPIGLGCGPLGEMNDHEAERLVHAALDMGVTVFDTAPSYGDSERRLGAALRGRSAVIVTKGGYGVAGCDEDWTPTCIARGIDQALSRLGHVDVFLLHSCPPRDDLVAPMVAARDAGKVSAIGYSGDGDALSWAAAMDAFDVLECSLNLFDQRALAHVGKKRTLAKRPLGNAPWNDDRRPTREDRAIYWDRMHAMFGERLAPSAAATSIRFVLASGVDCALVGTSSRAHLAEAVAAADMGPLPNASDYLARFAPHAAAFSGVV